MLDNFDNEFPDHEPRPVDAPHPLGGLRVLDFSHFIAGPLATMILADMGAEVIKIETPGRGGDLRRYPPPHPQLDHGAPFLWSNRNKKSVALDPKTVEGLALARELIAKADVLVENFSAGVMERLGLGHERCLAANPRLVYCSVAAYSRTGAVADPLGFDSIAQAESGFVAMNGYPDREGVRALSPVMDIGTAMMVGNAVMGALLARERTGRGQRVEVSLFDTAVLMTGYASMQTLFTGRDPQRRGNTSPDTCPSAAASGCSPSSTKLSAVRTGRTGRPGCVLRVFPAAWCGRWGRRSARRKRAITGSSRASRIQCWAGCRTCGRRSATTRHRWPIPLPPRRWASTCARSCARRSAFPMRGSMRWPLRARSAPLRCPGQPALRGRPPRPGRRGRGRSRSRSSRSPHRRPEQQNINGAVARHAFDHPHDKET